MEDGGGYRCPACGERTNVVDSRRTSRGHIRRRRQCSRCTVRFTTAEVETHTDSASVDRWFADIVELRDQMLDLPENERDLVIALIRVLARKRGRPSGAAPEGETSKASAES